MAYRPQTNLLRSSAGIFLVIAAICLLLSACSPSPFAIPPAPSQHPNDDQPIPSPPPQNSCKVDSDCITAGCSGTICQLASAEQVITTCEWKEEYACYQEVSCGCREGSCQWDGQQGLDACLQQHRSAGAVQESAMQESGELS